MPLRECIEMQNQTENHNKVRALRSQHELCERLAQEAGDPAVAEKLHDVAERLKAQANLQNAA
jgi:hypothetical protein